VPFTLLLPNNSKELAL
jgi:hypothetical protein